MKSKQAMTGLWIAFWIGVGFLLGYLWLLQSNQEGRSLSQKTKTTTQKQATSSGVASIIGSVIKWNGLIFRENTSQVLEAKSQIRLNDTLSLDAPTAEIGMLGGWVLRTSQKTKLRFQNQGTEILEGAAWFQAGSNAPRTSSWSASGIVLEVRSWVLFMEKKTQQTQFIFIPRDKESLQTNIWTFSGITVLTQSAWVWSGKEVSSKTLLGNRIIRRNLKQDFLENPNQMPLLLTPATQDSYFDSVAIRQEATQAILHKQADRLKDLIKEDIQLMNLKDELEAVRNTPLENNSEKKTEIERRVRELEAKIRSFDTDWVFKRNNQKSIVSGPATPEDSLE